jgi:hypothetical protein
VTAYACDYSRQVGETLAASAPHTETWLLLEYPRPWAAKAYAESGIPDVVKAYLDSQLAALPNGRLQLIGRGGRESLTDLALYTVDGRWGRGRVRRFMLPTYEALLDLPLALIARGEVDAGERVDAPLFIVCTNGRRDACCARHGLPVYNALRAAGADAWQCDHIGGHRFAGTMVAFPQGIYYGRVSAEDAPRIAAAHTRGGMLLANCRGRACAAPHVQAAELFLREQTGMDALDAFLEPAVTPEADGWRVHFASDHRDYAVAVSQEVTAFEVITNSGEMSGKPGTVYRCSLLQPG